MQQSVLSIAGMRVKLINSATDDTDLTYIRVSHARSVGVERLASPIVSLNAAVF
jgi:hypothetical protein